MWSNATGLSVEQTTAVKLEAARLSITAGPGAGKTRVLTRRIARRVHSGETPPRRVVAVTYTRPAALEMCGRLAKLDVHGVTAATFHGFGRQLLARRHADGLGPAPNLVKRSDICRRLLAHLQEDRLEARQLDTEIGWATSRMLDAGSYADAAIAARRSLTVGFPRMAELMAAYQAWKVRRGAIDFDDLILLPLAYLEQDHEWAAAVRWQYRHFYVDEYQDTTPLQSCLLQALVGDSADICVVGDPRQSIFGFAGAQADAFDAFHGSFPDAMRVELTQNFRSGSSIVAAGNSLTETPMNTDGEKHPGQVVLQAYTRAEDEAEAVAEAIWQAGAPWGDHAVLARTYSALGLVAQALRDRGIPFYRPGDLLKHREVRWVLHELEGLSGHLPAISVRKDMAEIVDDVLAHYSGEHPGHDLFHDEFTDDDEIESPPPASPLVGPLELRLIRHNLDELQGLLEEYLAATNYGTLEGFVFWLAASTQEPTATRAPQGMVDLRTIHRAKGLEWRNVYLVGCTADLLPLWSAADETEESRLMFVAVTRASEKLVCTWPMNGVDRRHRPVRLERSPFLTLVESGVSAVPGEEPLSPAALSGLAAKTLGETRALLAGIDRNPPRPLTTQGRHPGAPSVEVVRLGGTAFNEDRALSGIAAHLGTTVDELRARMKSDQRVASQARIVLGSLKHLPTPPKREQEVPT